MYDISWYSGNICWGLRRTRTKRKSRCRRLPWLPSTVTALGYIGGSQPPTRWPSSVTALGPFSILRGLPQTSWLPLFCDRSQPCSFLFCVASQAAASHRQADSPSSVTKCGVEILRRPSLPARGVARSSSFFLARSYFFFFYRCFLPQFSKKCPAPCCLWGGHPLY